jgi:ADP-ribosylglycohydrolase
MTSWNTSFRYWIPTNSPYMWILEARMNELDRATGSLIGLALGDALGMPTQSFSLESIRERYGVISRLEPGPADQPIAPGMAAGSVTDDTEQAMLLAEILIAGDGDIDSRKFADALRNWEHDMIRRGSLDLLGPSTRAALSALDQGADPEEAGAGGATNGAAMRIAPVGVAFKNGPRLLRAVHQASLVTHNTRLGMGAAAAVAAAVSAGIDGATVAQAIDQGIEGSRKGSRLGHWIAGGDIASRVEYFRPVITSKQGIELIDFLNTVVGTSVASQESVVAAMLIADHFADAPFEGLCIAASVGGDTDTIAAIAGAILGSCSGESGFPKELTQQVVLVNHLNFEQTAQQLLELRGRE